MMNLSPGPELQKFIALNYRANRPTMLAGGFGVGKSEAYEEAAALLGIGIVVRDLSILEPPDLVGMPRVDGESMVYATPSFLPREGAGLFVIEELNRAPRYMRSPCLQLLTTRTLNDYRLPPGWLPCTAINLGEGFDVDELDPALLSRFVKVRVDPDLKAWCAWAATHGVDTAVVEFLKAMPKSFEHEDGNPRAWKYASDILTSWRASAERDVTALRASLVGVLNDKLGIALASFVLEEEAPLTADAILNSYEESKPTARRWLKRGRLDLLKMSWDALRRWLQVQRNYDAIVEDDGERKKNVEAFFKDLPPDLVDEAREWCVERDYTELSIPGGRRGRR